MTPFEATNSDFNITDENNSFSISMPGSWKIPYYLADQIVIIINNLIKFKSENDIGLHVEEVRKRGNKIKIGDKEYNLTDFDSSKNEILEELKSANYHDL